MTIQVYLLLKTNTRKKVDKEQISIVSKQLDSKNLSKSNDIQLRIIKEFSEIFEAFLAKNLNEYINKSFFHIK